MPRRYANENVYWGFDRTKVLAIVLAAVIFVAGYFAYSLYMENRAQAQTILGQQSDIESKAGQISLLDSQVNNLTQTVAGQVKQIFSIQGQLSEANGQISDLNGRLGSANLEIASLKPKIEDYYVVGVDNNGKGVVVPIEVKIVKGTGSVSASINNVDLLSGTQESIRTAAQAASNLAGVPISDKDITVTFVHSGLDVVTVDGPSAGAAITVTIAGALENRSMSSKILMTGTIDSAGFIGPVGGVPAKAQAAKDFGASTFIVPSGEGNGISIGGLNVTEIIEISKAAGMILQ